MLADQHLVKVETQIFFVANRNIPRTLYMNISTSLLLMRSYGKMTQFCVREMNEWTDCLYELDTKRSLFKYFKLPLKKQIVKNIQIRVFVQLYVLKIVTTKLSNKTPVTVNLYNTHSSAHNVWQRVYSLKWLAWNSVPANYWNFSIVSKYTRFF